MQRIQTIPFRNIVIAGISSIFALLAIAFVLFQARYLLLGPQLSLTNEPIGPQNQQRISLSGTARNISHLWLNDRQIFTDPSGIFTEDIILENGYTIVTLRAEDRYGRRAVIEKPLVYTPASFIQ